MPGNDNLHHKVCVPCQGGIAPMSKEDAQMILPAIAGWQLDENAIKLKRSFIFNNFIQAQAFAVRVGDISEIENHHRDICYGWSVPL